MLLLLPPAAAAAADAMRLLLLASAAAAVRLLPAAAAAVHLLLPPAAAAVHLLLPPAAAAVPLLPYAGAHPWAKTPQGQLGEGCPVHLCKYTGMVFEHLTECWMVYMQSRARESVHGPNVFRTIGRKSCAPGLTGERGVLE
jgi:hypothetical protein